MRFTSGFTSALTARLALRRHAVEDDEEVLAGAQRAADRGSFVFCPSAG